MSRRRHQHYVKPPLMPDLFTTARARRKDPDTSHAAARKVERGRLEDLALEALRKLRQATTREVANDLGRERDSISPRMVNLEKRGLARRTTLRRDGCTVWEAVDE